MSAAKHTPGHVATATDRAKDPYLSADSIVYESEQTEPAKHTPLPWRITKGLYGRKNELTIWGPENSVGCHPFVATIGSLKSKANAAFIVRACNSHEELLELLRQCLDVQVRYYDEHEGCPVFVEEIKAAIAKAKGEA